MDRLETLEKFENEQFAQVFDSNLLEFEKFYQNNLEKLSDQLSKCFLECCDNINSLQEENTLSSISSINFTILRTNLIENDFKFPIYVCDEKWWLDENKKIVGYFDCTFIFRYYNDIINTLENLRKVYVGKTTAQDVFILLAKHLNVFIDYIANILRYKIFDLVLSDSFVNIQKKEILEIYVCEYIGVSTCIYIENAIPLDKDAFMLHYDSNVVENLSYCDFRKINLSNQNFEFLVVQNSNFENSNFDNSNFIKSILDFSNFKNCTFLNSSFEDSTLFECIFENSNLINCNFKNVKAYCGFTDYNSIDKFGYYGANFKNANLTNANFIGAELKGANFEGAIMNNTVFNKNHLSYLNLSPIQKSSIKVVD